MDKKVKHLLESTVEIDRINGVEILTRSSDPSSVNVLIGMIKHEKSINVLNAVAMALGALRADNSVPVLMEYILNPDNVNRRGSFVYALESLDTSNYTLEIVNLIITGNYEVANSALNIFEKDFKRIPTDVKLQAEAMLLHQLSIEQKKQSEQGRYDKINFIREALECFQ